jgi:hypothetical protein
MAGARSGPAFPRRPGCGDLGIALDVAGEGLRELRSLEAGYDKRSTLSYF